MSAVQQLEAALHDQPSTPLKPNQIEEYNAQLSVIEDVMKIPGTGRGAADTRRRQIQKILHDQAPRQIDEPMRRDQVAKLAETVLREEIVPALQPQTVMRRNPSGAVGAFLQGENSRTVQHAISTWKRARRALDPTNEDPDYANVERYRPTGLIPGASTFMADAQIPGVFAMSPQAKENWPLDPPQTTAVAQVKKREYTEEQRQAMRDRLAAVREKRHKKPEG